MNKFYYIQLATEILLATQSGRWNHDYEKEILDRAGKKGLNLKAVLAERNGISLEQDADILCNWLLGNYDAISKRENLKNRLFGKGA